MIRKAELKLNQPTGPNPNRRRLLIGVGAILLLVVGFLLVRQWDPEWRDESTTPAEFLEALYSGDISRVEMLGETQIRWQRQLDLDVNRTTWYRTSFPSYQVEALHENIYRFVGRPYTSLAKTSLIRKLDEGNFDLRDAWTFNLGGQRTLFVQAYDDQGNECRYRVETQLQGNEELGEVEVRLAEADVKVAELPLPEPDVISYKESKESTSLLVPFLLGLLIVAAVWFYVRRKIKSTGGVSGLVPFGQARPALINWEQVSTTFDDVAGIDEAKSEVREIVEFLKDPGRFSRLGARIPSGVLLVGAPGTGKTLLAKAIAGEARVPFFSMSGSDFVEMFVGVGASRVRDLFRQARKHSPCLVFLDEIDAVGRKRGAGGAGGGQDEREQTLNAILVEMDGFSSGEGVILLGATNRMDILDPALLRPGRFDRQVVIPLPDLKGRLAILGVHAQEVKVAPNVDLSIVARGTPGFSGAELEAVVNEATLKATLAGKDGVELEDLEEARDTVRWGRQKKNQERTLDDQRITAYHEAGHALVALLHKDVEPLHKVTIIPRGISLGATMMLPERDRHSQSRNQVRGLIAFAYGGRIAEEITFDDISIGAQDDIHKATELARRMVCVWGLSETLGPISFVDKSSNRYLGMDFQQSRNHSEATSVTIDKEITRIIHEIYNETRQMIEQNRHSLDLIVKALLKYETLSGSQVAAVVNGTALDDLLTISAMPASPSRTRATAEQTVSRVEADPSSIDQET